MHGLLHDLIRLIGDFLDNDLEFCRYFGLKARSFNGECRDFCPAEYDLRHFACCVSYHIQHTCRTDFDCSNLKWYITIGNLPNLESFRGTRLTNLVVSEVKSTLEPLRGVPIKLLRLHKFEGDLEPLRGAPIKFIELGEFKGDLAPLSESPLKYVAAYEFDGDLEPLYPCASTLEKINIPGFQRNAGPLEKFMRRE